jgi:hypothetical protein
MGYDGLLGPGGLEEVGFDQDPAPRPHAATPQGVQNLEGPPPEIFVIVGRGTADDLGGHRLRRASKTVSRKCRR